MERNKGGFETPGTLVLAIIFLIWFLVFYFANWVILSRLWEVS
jgi:cytochrome c oxidase subunit 1